MYWSNRKILVARAKILDLKINVRPLFILAIRKLLKLKLVFWFSRL